MAQSIGLEQWKPKINDLIATPTGYKMTIADGYKIAISPKAQLKVTGMGTQLPAKNIQVSKTTSVGVHSPEQE